MKQKVMSIFTRTPMHVGAGSSVGAVDQPIIRERHTGFPIIPGSSLKGVLAALWTDEANRNDKKQRIENSDLEVLFGSDGDDKKAKAGKLLVGEGKIFAFPVRSAKNAFAWCTCPLVLARAKRDIGLDVPASALAVTEADHCLAPASMTIKDKVILEEYCLQNTGNIDEVLTKTLQGIADDAAWQEELLNHLVVLSDEMFSYFVENACEIAQHVRIDAGSGTAVSGGLFNQVNVPAETMFYSILHQTQDGLSEKVSAKLAEQDDVLQIGADAGAGLGWSSVKLLDKLA
ncbi:MAG: type III-B CRISPR module RAMP protein Cmr4 [Lentisphaeria bacterium]